MQLIWIFFQCYSPSWASIEAISSPIPRVRIRPIVKRYLPINVGPTHDARPTLKLRWPHAWSVLFWPTHSNTTSGIKPYRPPSMRPNSTESAIIAVNDLMKGNNNKPIPKQVVANWWRSKMLTNLHFSSLSLQNMWLLKNAAIAMEV